MYDISAFWKQCGVESQVKCFGNMVQDACASKSKSQTKSLGFVHFLITFLGSILWKIGIYLCQVKHQTFLNEFESTTTMSLFYHNESIYSGSLQFDGDC